jgi:hypothetical protein
MLANRLTLPSREQPACHAKAGEEEMRELAMSELLSPGIWQAIFATFSLAVVYLALYYLVRWQ